MVYILSEIDRERRENTMGSSWNFLREIRWAK